MEKVINFLGGKPNGSDRTGVFDVAVTTNVANGENPVGTAYDSTCANEAYCRICTEGICPARLDTDETCATTELITTSGDQNGRAKCYDATVSHHSEEIGNPASYSTSAGDVILIWAHRN